MKRIARVAVDKPGRVLAVTGLLMLVALVAGNGLISRLSTGGFDDTNSQATRAAATLDRVFHQGNPDVVLVVAAKHGTVDDGDVDAAGRRIGEELAAQDGVTQVASYWSLGNAPPLRSKDGTTALVFARIPGNQNHQNQVMKRLSPLFTRDTGAVRVRVGGFAEVFRQVTTQVQDDLKKAELIAIPLSMLLLLFVFRGAVAAALPMVVGGVAVLGTMLVLRIIAATTEVSVFALNLTTGMGLGLGIDYSLLLVSRYREELERDGAGHRRDALVRAVQTAGRTIVFSGLTVCASMAALLVFPLVFLRSFAYAGVPVVAVAVVGAVVVLPAVLALLGPRVDMLAVRRKPAPPVGEGAWHRVATLVMRRPIPIAAAVIAFLLFLGAPFLHVAFGFPDDRVLPQRVSSRQVNQQLRDDFEAKEAFPIWVVANDVGDTNAIAPYAATLSRVRGVDRVDSYAGSYINGVRAFRLDALAERFVAPGATYFNVVPSVEPFSTAGEHVVHAIRRLPAPFPVEVGGRTAALVDNKSAAFGRMPLAAGIIVLVSFLVLFAFFGSVVIPVKAFVLNLLSLTATFGAMVWIFQDGHLARWLDFTATGTIDLSTPILMFCVAFGLSMDYEVFLLSRVKEEYDRTGDNVSSVAIGLERSGRIVTAAALLLSAVFLAFATSGVSFIKLFGVGLAVAIVVDATLVRATLVPAFMRLAGDLNWWAPGPLRRLHERWGIRESAAPEARVVDVRERRERPLVAAGRERS